MRLGKAGRVKRTVGRRREGRGNSRGGHSRLNVDDADTDVVARQNVRAAAEAIFIALGRLGRPFRVGSVSRTGDFTACRPGGAGGKRGKFLRTELRERQIYDGQVDEGEGEEEDGNPALQGFRLHECSASSEHNPDEAIP